MADAVPNHSPRISLIIPCWRDTSEALRLAHRWSGDPRIHEVILATVAGASIAAGDGKIKICAAPRPGRGEQLNYGAARAGGEILLFHHVDSELTGPHLEALIQVMRNPAIQGGAFYRKFDERHPFLLWAEGIERWHSRTFGALYGDQSIFVRRERFVTLGGFAPIPLMEDVEFSLRLRRSSRIALLDPPMSSSPARQIEQGAWRTTMRNMLFLVLFRCGVPADFLHRWYYRRSRNEDAPKGNQPADNNRYGTKVLTPIERDHGV